MKIRNFFLLFLFTLGSFFPEMQGLSRAITPEQVGKNLMQIAFSTIRNILGLGFIVGGGLMATGIGFRLGISICKSTALGLGIIFAATSIIQIFHRIFGNLGS